MATLAQPSAPHDDSPARKVANIRMDTSGRQALGTGRPEFRSASPKRPAMTASAD
jgi:hypothetical protein